MGVVLVTGSSGLVGSEAVAHFCGLGHTVLGIDNDMRRVFFGDTASTEWNRRQLEDHWGKRFEHHNVDIRDAAALRRIFERHGTGIELVVHAAAQPSHDWAAREPLTDFSVNATGTLNLLEQTRRHCPAAVFVFCSTNKVYGDNPNLLPLIELEHRWEIEPGHRYEQGIAESMSLDFCKHSLFGVSKLAADMLVQEYGRYFGMRTAVFRAGCLTGSGHSGAELHGFLSYLARCVVTGTPYSIYGYKGKQVRDNLHSTDLVAAFARFFDAPRIAEVYNMGGGRFSNCSMLEAISMCEELTGQRLTTRYVEENRSGDHIWWISDTRRFEDHFPGWKPTRDVRAILSDIIARNSDRWAAREPE
ncbi:MAG: NAD-dependent epimerase/dehydratase family protein [Gemmatimonadota bacterium]